MALADNVAWYRKYRPYNMDDYIGDDIKHIVEARFTKAESRPNVIMIQGTRGCGKTTFARIISKYYLCEEQVDGKPCENCEVCRSINEGLIDGEADGSVEGVIEVDATTANGKDAIQEIISDAIIPPMYTKYKVIILDEAHMITPTAQNSLLKVIEDVPPHLIVIFCTTNMEKVIGTIISRCQVKLEVTKKTVDEMANRLMFIANKEGLTTSIEALKIIAKKGDRVPRECINILENIAKSYCNIVTIENVRSSLGDVEAEIYMDYFRAANSGLEDILIFNKKLKDINVTTKAFMKGLIRFTLDCMYIRYGIAIEDYPLEYAKKVKELFGIYCGNEFDALVQVIEYAANEIGEDDNKNELIITTTALRISKISLLAKGLAEETVYGEKENKLSISNYKKTVDSEIKKQINNASYIAPTKEAFNDIFKSMKEIANAGENIQIKTEDIKEDNRDSEYYSEDELNSLME